VYEVWIVYVKIEKNRIWLPGKNKLTAGLILQVDNPSAGKASLIYQFRIEANLN